MESPLQHVAIGRDEVDNPVPDVWPGNTEAIRKLIEGHHMTGLMG